MKILLALLLTASMAFVLIGCSDNAAVPVSPTDRHLQTPASVGKADVTNFTFSHHPIAPPFGGDVKLVGQVFILKDIGVMETIVSTNTLVAGTMVHYLSATMNATTGEGPVHGRGTIRPTGDVGGGVWEMTYEGYRSYKETVGDIRYYTLPLKVVAHGKGGTIDGMRSFFETTITAWGTPPAGWYGGGGGFYKSH